MTHLHYLSQILPGNPIVYLCAGFSDGKAIEPYVGPLASAPNLQFYSINPTSGSRSSANVTAYHNFLFEPDCLPLDIQHQLLPALTSSFPIRLATYSGSKSIHLIVSLADTAPVEPGTDTGLQWYKKAWQALYAEMENMLLDKLRTLVGDEQYRAITSEPNFKTFDRATSDPSRLSRTPEALRGGNIVQSALHVGPLLSVDDLLAIMSKHKKQSSAHIVNKAEPVDFMPLDSFERLLYARPSLHYVKMQFEQDRNWRSASGHYDKLFKLALWVYDATGVPKETLLTYLQKHTFPVIFNSGYPRDPARAIHDAYRMKGAY